MSKAPSPKADQLRALREARTKKPAKSIAAVVWKEAMTSLLADIQRCESIAHTLGAHVTGHALNAAKNALGWEIAGDLEQAANAAKGMQAGAETKVKKK